MIIKKIIPGYVVQTRHINSKNWRSQEFIAGDEYTYEDEHGNFVDVMTILLAINSEPYLSCDMIQPR